MSLFESGTTQENREHKNESNQLEEGPNQCQKWSQIGEHTTQIQSARASTSIIHLSGYIPTGIRLIVDDFRHFTSRACAQRKGKYLWWIHAQNSSHTLTQWWCLAEETYTFQFCMCLNSLFPVRCLLERRTVPHTVFNQYILEVAGLEIQWALFIY